MWERQGSLPESPRSHCLRFLRYDAREALRIRVLSPGSGPDRLQATNASEEAKARLEALRFRHMSEEPPCWKALAVVPDRERQEIGSCVCWQSRDDSPSFSRQSRDSASCHRCRSEPCHTAANSFDQHLCVSWQTGRCSQVTHLRICTLLRSSLSCWSLQSLPAAS